MGHFQDRQLWLQILLLGLPELQNYTGAEQSQVLLQILTNYGIHKDNLRWFILNNTIKNNTGFVQISETISFDRLKQ